MVALVSPWTRTNAVLTLLQSVSVVRVVDEPVTVATVPATDGGFGARRVVVESVTRHAGTKCQVKGIW